ncbi:MAG: OmpA family protein, partial [Gammaproteobacteria bacterium]
MWPIVAERMRHGDGVVDSKDQCPNTARGAKVDAKGCALVTTLNGVHFEFDSAVLTGKAEEVLDQAAATLKSSSGSVVVVGHTDDRGDAGYNQQLSEARAQAATSYLISQGVSASRLSAKGMGQTEPVADNGTANGRAMNRRVELRFKKEFNQIGFRSRPPAGFPAGGFLLPVNYCSRCARPVTIGRRSGSQ